MRSRLRLFAGLLLCSAAFSWSGAAGEKADPNQARLAELESRVGGRLGVAAEWAGTAGEARPTRPRVAFRGEERFPLCSTFKFLLAAAILHRVDEGLEKLERLLPYTEADLLSHAPVAKQHLAKGALSVEALCAAAVVQSDNTAANLLLATMDGPAGLTAFLRKIGDPETRLDRNEESLNTAIPGDPRDTTTPNSILFSMRTLLQGNVLKPESRRRLEQWALDCATGGARIRAGVPAGWQVGDKTGTGANGTSNDIAFLRLEAGKGAGETLFLAIYLTGSKASGKERDAVIAEATRVVLGTMMRDGR